MNLWNNKCIQHTYYIYTYGFLWKWCAIPKGCLLICTGHSSLPKCSRNSFKMTWQSWRVSCTKLPQSTHALWPPSWHLLSFLIWMRWGQPTSPGHFCPVRAFIVLRGERWWKVKPALGFDEVAAGGISLKNCQLQNQLVLKAWLPKFQGWKRPAGCSIGFV